KDINEFEPATLEEGQENEFKAMWDRQAELRERYAEIERANGFYVPDGVCNLDDAKDQHFLKDFAWRITEELGEAMNCLKNKPWKQTHMETDKEHFVEELIDGLHFYLELLQWAGLSRERVVQIYFDKSRVNKFRQR